MNPTHFTHSVQGLRYPAGNALVKDHPFPQFSSKKKFPPLFDWFFTLPPHHGGLEMKDGLEH